MSIDPKVYELCVKKAERMFAWIRTAVKQDVDLAVEDDELYLRGGTAEDFQIIPDAWPKAQEELARVSAELREARKEGVSDLKKFFEDKIWNNVDKLRDLIDDNGVCDFADDLTREHGAEFVSGLSNTDARVLILDALSKLPNTTPAFVEAATLEKERWVAIGMTEREYNEPI